MRIVVAGVGRIGGTLARIWAGRGHDVVLTLSRREEEVRRLAEEIGATSAAPSEAVAGADAVLLAVPAGAVDEAVAALGSLDGRVLIDAVNDVGRSEPGSVAQDIAAKAPGARVVKAVNTVFAPMYPEAAASPGRAHMVICGDDAEAKETVAALVRDLGFEPVDAGGLDAAPEVEAFARLVIRLAYRQGLGPFAHRFGSPREL
jgi:predicted dinucleotide-binding enzyme